MVQSLPAAHDVKDFFLWAAEIHCFAFCCERISPSPLSLPLSRALSHHFFGMRVTQHHRHHQSKEASSTLEKKKAFHICPARRKEGTEIKPALFSITKWKGIFFFLSFFYRMYFACMLTAAPRSRICLDRPRKSRYLTGLLLIFRVTHFICPSVLKSLGEGGAELRSTQRGGWVNASLMGGILASFFSFSATTKVQEIRF